MNAKNKNNRNNKAGKNRDIIGIILIVISSFFLICLVTPLLSDIGTFVKRLTTGLFGYTSYPIFLCMLFYGILMLMNKRAAVSKKQIAFIVLMVLSALLILQTALDAPRLTGSMGAYLSTLIGFSASTTAGHSVGGVALGIFAYCFKTILTFVGAYILYSLLFVIFSALLILDLRSGKKAVVRDKKRASTPFVKGLSEAQPVKEFKDTTLFVANIEPSDTTSSQSGSFSSMYTSVLDSMPRYDSAPSVSEYDRESDSQKERARKVLFGDTEERLKEYDSSIKNHMQIKEFSSGRSNYLLDDNNIPKASTSDFLPYNAVSAPSVSGDNNTPRKPVQKLPDVPFPPEKDISHQVHEGPILNGEEFSKAFQDSIRLRKPPEERPDFSSEAKYPDAEQLQKELPPIVNGDIYLGEQKRQPEPPKTARMPEPQIVEDEGPADIVNGDDFSMSFKEWSKTAKDDALYYVDEPEAEPKPEEQVNDIIKASDYLTPKKADKKAENIDNSGLFEQNNVEKEEEKAVEKTKTIFDLDFDEPLEEPSNEDNAPDEVGKSYTDELATDEPSAEITEPEQAEEEPEQPAIEEIGDDIGEEAEPTDSVELEDTTVESEPFDESEATIEGEPVEENEAATEGEPVKENEAAIEGEPVEENEAAIEGEPDDAIEGEPVEESEAAIESEPIEESEPEQKPEEPHIQAKIPDSLKLIDEEVNLSETREEIDDDNTGYYEQEKSFAKKVDEISLKLDDGAKNGKTNQIKMDDYKVDVPSEPPKKKRKHLRYTPPPIDMLINSSTKPEFEDHEEKSKSLEEVLHNLKVDAKVIQVTQGPAVTRYELEVPLGQTVKRIPNCADDIAYSLAAPGMVRIEAPIKGKRAVGVEVPNKSIAIVSLREIIDSKVFSEAKSCLTLALGKDITGNIITCNLEKMPHLLIAGTTGSGKSACLNSIIISILYKASPDDVRIILIDPKQVEFVLYREMPHLLMKNIINDCQQAINAFKWARDEMDRRYTLFAKYAVRNLGDFNECAAVKTGVEQKLPRIVIIVDELGELMLAKNSKELELNIMSMAQKARAAGMHLILATQRPSVDVLTGTIKANLPSRIAFAVKSIPDSRTILDQVGAETLLGMGDMLYFPLNANEPMRVQGAFITTEEIENIVNFVRSNNEVDYDETAENIIMKKQEEISAAADDDKGGEQAEDPLMKEVLRRVIETKQASASMIQRRFSVGYNKASRIIDQMEEKGYIGPLDGAKPREVFITAEMFKNIYGEDL